MKKHIFGLIATLSWFAFVIGIGITSVGNFYQPELPDELK